ncbi:MAG: hypothetical protein A2104_04945 [Candidatus Melainabacteria bacterium GWF2_32_7]|nr:MAG: hypothetical protein A2104_04945 [Candidatus Melainabacteria bacterium GWF2_32_7]
MNKINNNLSKKFGKKIKIERIKKDLSQEQLAGLHRTNIGFIERGETSPTLDTVEKLANALNIQAYKLFIFEE